MTSVQIFLRKKIVMKWLVGKVTELRGLSNLITRTRAQGKAVLKDPVKK